MAINRRSFCISALAGLTWSTSRLLATPHSQHLLSCRSNEQGEHFVSLLDSDGTQLMNIRLPARGHGITVNPAHRQAAVFARRPGEYLWILDLGSRSVIHKLTPPSGRHYYGHGDFTPDGRFLLCSENAYERGTGCIGIYDASSNFKRLGEIESHGIGPHEIRLLNGSQTLVIANGGIKTHPDLPRIKSNLDTMRPNLAYVDIPSGQLLHKHEPPSEWHQLSIRHIDVAADNSVAVAMQYQGNATEKPPLIALQKGNRPLRFLTTPRTIQTRMRNYCGSVAFSGDSTRFAVSSPRGGLVTYWTSDGEYIGTHQQRDACGIAEALNEREFIVSDGRGHLELIRSSLQKYTMAVEPEYRWDNHLVSI